MLDSLSKDRREQETINFFITGNEFLNGVNEEAREKVAEIYSDFSKELKADSIETTFDRPIEEKNYGRGADWVLAAAEFLATNPYVKAAATTGGSNNTWKTHN